jgi:hypothetical protein
MMMFSFYLINMKRQRQGIDRMVLAAGTQYPNKID